MKRQEKYRFYIVNGCDTTGDNYDVTGIAIPGIGYTYLTLGDPHNGEVGDWVKLTGFSPNTANIIAQILQNGDTQIGIQEMLGIDVDIWGNVALLNGKRYVTPLNYYISKFDWEKESDEIFFRMFFNEPLTFTGADFAYFRDFILGNPCCEVKFVIEKLCDDEWTTYWEGYFAHNSCKWDLSNCRVDVKFDLDDKYRCLFSGYEDSQTVFDTVLYYERLYCCLEEVTIGTLGGGPCTPPCSGIPTGLGDDGSNPPIFNDDRQFVDPCDGSPRGDWQLESTEITQTTFTGGPVENFTVCTSWVRQVAITQDSGGAAVPPAGSGWGISQSVIYNGLPGHKWTRYPYGGTYYTFSDYTFTTDCAGMPCSRRWDVTFPDELDYNTLGEPMGDVISTLAKNSCAKLAGMRSDFFEYDAPADTPGYVPGTNYVTGSASQILHLKLLRVSDFLTYNANDDLSEIQSEGTLKELLIAICILFNCKWFIDSDSFIRIEHISWFTQNAGIDTTIGINGFRNKSRKDFSFMRQEIPLREEFKCVYAGYKDFVGLPIIYNSPCVNIKKVATYQTPKLSTDVKYVRDNADTLKDFESLMLIACDVDGNILSETGILSGLSFENAHLSWANLHYNYHRHYRYLDSGIMNEAETAFLSVRKTKLQSGIKYLGTCCTEINPLTDLITTELGDGQIENMEKDNRDERFLFNLLYD